MQTETVPIDSLTPDPANARKHSKRNLDAIAASLERFGQQKPIVVDESGVVWAGNGTLAAALQLGWSEIAIVRSDLAGDEMLGFAIADNRTAELASWSDELDPLLQSLMGSDVVSAMGFNEGELSRLTGIGATEDEAPDLPTEAITQLGDLWLLGDHRLLCGDSTNADDVALLLDGNKPGLMVTDPPYGIGEARGKNKRRDNLAVAKDYGVASWDDCPIDLIAMSALIDTSKYAAIFGGNFYSLPPSSCWLVWDKENGASDFADAELAWTNYPGAVRLKRHLWSGMRRKGNEQRDHPTQKPLAVMAWVIEQCPCEPETIFDPFLGSGTTLIAAEQLNRKCFAMELSPVFVDAAVQRWEAFTGGKAERIRHGS